MAHERGDVGRVHIVIAVDKGDGRARHRVQAGVACRAQAAVALVYHLDAVVAGGVLVTQRAAGVGAAVVHEDDLQVVVRLLEHRVNASCKILLHVIDRNDDGYHFFNSMHNSQCTMHNCGCALINAQFTIVAEFWVNA